MKSDAKTGFPARHLISKVKSIPMWYRDRIAVSSCAYLYVYPDLSGGSSVFRFTGWPEMRGSEVLYAQRLRPDAFYNSSSAIDIRCRNFVVLIDATVLRRKTVPLSREKDYYVPYSASNAQQMASTVSKDLRESSIIELS